MTPLEAREAVGRGVRMLDAFANQGIHHIPMTWRFFLTRDVSVSHGQRHPLARIWQRSMNLPLLSLTTTREGVEACLAIGGFFHYRPYCDTPLGDDWTPEYGLKFVRHGFAGMDRDIESWNALSRVWLEIIEQDGFLIDRMG